MERTLTVKGTGNINLTPDTAVISMTLKSIDMDYETASKESARATAALKSALEHSGFDKDSIKNTGFNVNTEYESITDENGRYKSEFAGYAFVHQLKIEFDFQSERLSSAIYAISKSSAEPEMHIQFTVKDKEAARGELLKSAAENALEKAKILAEASGVRLGELLSVTYNDNIPETFFNSNINYGMDEMCMAKGSCAAIDFNPDGIELSDSAVFVWRIE